MLDLTSTKTLTRIGAYVTAVIVLYFLIRYIYRKVKLANVSKQKVDIFLLDPNKNYDNFAKTVHDAFDPWLGTMSETMETACTQLQTLDDNELKHVNNRYVFLYGKGARSLEDAVNDYWICSNCDNCEALQLRLKSLNIN